MTTDHAPLSPGERIHALDIIRGFALLGILLMNIEYFQRPMQAIVFGFDSTQAGIDHAVAWFSYAFVQGKFYTMFSLLFGLGFVVFLDRALQKGASARLLFARRLLVLLAIGAAHAFLVWSGDILLNYALVGFLLLFFARTPARRLWKWGVFFFVVPTLLMWVGAFSIEAAIQAGRADEMLGDFAANRERVVADIANGHLVYAAGTYWEAVAWRAHELGFFYRNMLFFVPTVLGMFLIGAAFGRAGVFSSLDANWPLFRRMMLFGYGIGLPAALVWGIHGADIEMMFPTVKGAALMTSAAIANMGLCLAYIGTLVALLRGGRMWLMRLAPVGRMALTNYLMHSVVFTLLFYGYGAGLYGEFGRAATTLMALALYAFQVWFSGWWLERYRIGPMEWLWRTLTYGRVQPFRSSAHSAA
ncbi:MAG: DUF418 domain-containing protein [Xanthomonadaceae bacterium]|nr:DUF418 domain-containing protein [Xanthomonadaceae bacterium]